MITVFAMSDSARYEQENNQMNRKNKRKTIITAMLALCLLLLPHGSAQAFRGMGSGGSIDGAGTDTSLPGSTSNMPSNHTENSKTVVARVNGAEITMGALMHTVKDILMQKYRNMAMTPGLAQRIRYDALEELAMEELAFQHAVSSGITVNQTEIDQRLGEIIQAEGGEDALQISLSQRNKSIEDLKSDIRRFLSVKMAIEQEVDSQVTITEEEINTAYEANKEQFVIPERVVITDIIFFLDPADPASAERVRSVREQIISELNNDPTKLTPKDFVVVSNTNVSPEDKPELYQAAKNIEVGSTSEPLNIDGTLHLIKKDFYQPRKEKEASEAKAVVASKLKSFKKKQLLAEWRQNLMKDAKIEIVHELLQEDHSNTSPQKLSDVDAKK